MTSLCLWFIFYERCTSVLCQFLKNQQSCRSFAPKQLGPRIMNSQTNVHTLWKIRWWRKKKNVPGNYEQATRDVSGMSGQREEKTPFQQQQQSPGRVTTSCVHRLFGPDCCLAFSLAASEDASSLGALYAKLIYPNISMAIAAAAPAAQHQQLC